MRPKLSELRDQEGFHVNFQVLKAGKAEKPRKKMVSPFKKQPKQKKIGQI